MGRRIGVFGGTFDPIHLGHLIVAEEARAALDLDHVLFVPARQSPLKADHPRAGDADRVAMIELALADAPGFRIDRVDLDRPAPSFTVDTLAALRARLGGDADLWFILGADALAELPAWRAPDRIAAEARLAVFERPGWMWDADRLDAAIPGVRDRIDVIPSPPIGISATDLRRRVAAGRPIRYQVPRAVEAYIRDWGVYAPR